MVSAEELLGKAIHNVLSPFIGLPITELNKHEMRQRICEALSPIFSRKEIPLEAGEMAPGTPADYPPPMEGFRWETDQEFRKRIMIELQKHAAVETA